jgi:hypothetical protein
MSDPKNGPTPRREDQRRAKLQRRRDAEAEAARGSEPAVPETPPEPVSCSGGLTLKRPGAGNG